MRMGCVAGAAAFGLMTTVSLAETPTLTGNDLKAIVVGKTVVMNTPVGGIPVVYRDNGTMVGRAKDLQMYTGQERDRGKWWVRADQICQQWETWLDARQYCFTVRLEGQTLHWKRNDGTTGTATIASN